MPELNDRRPTPCEDCGSRKIIETTRNHFSLFGGMIELEYIVCAGCGTERDDLYDGATLEDDMVSGWEVFDGKEWRLEIP